MRFSFVFLFVAVSVLSCILSNPWISEAAAVRNIPVEAVAEFEKRALKNDAVECGASGANANERIVGGEKAPPHAWPWQVLLYCTNGTHDNYCGGSLVAGKWVITAAHCVSVAENFKCVVLLGMHYFPTPTTVATRGRLIEKYFVHEQYNDSSETIDFDIALLKLNKTVKYGKNVKPICLQFDLPELDNTSDCYATGWGREDPDIQDAVKVLKQLHMPIHDDYEYCKFSPHEIEHKICAGSWDREDDVCMGDSGGPLACREADGKWYLRGVASFGHGEPKCLICHSVASFTKVAAFQDWIIEKIACEATKHDD